MMFGLSLEWPRCRDGVELHDYGERKKSEPLLSGTLSGEWYRYRTNRRFQGLHNLTDLEDPIVLRFVNAKDDSARLEFLSRFGLTAWDSFNKRPVEEISRNSLENDQAALHRLLIQLDGGTPLNTAARRINAALGKHQNFALTPNLDFAAGGETPRLAFKPQSLMGYMLLEIASIAAAGARTKLCQHCGIMFATGHLTWRRSRAIYCGDRCRVAAMRERRKAEAK